MNTDPNPDAELIAICLSHCAARSLYCSVGELSEEEDDRLYAELEALRDKISVAAPMTMQGILAKAKSAAEEALLPSGKLDFSEYPAAGWSVDLVRDLLRLNGGAV